MSAGSFQPVFSSLSPSKDSSIFDKRIQLSKKIQILRDTVTQSPSKFEFPNETSFDNLLESVYNELAMPLLTCNNHVLRKRVVASKLHSNIDSKFGASIFGKTKNK